MSEPRRTVLVVDDNRQNLMVAEGYLLMAGYDVLCAESGQQALEILAAHGADLVLLDILMPVMDGFETCRRLRATPGGEHAPILFLTALQDAAHQQRALESGGDDFLTKPIQRVELLMRVRSLIRIKQMHVELEEKNAALRRAQELRRRLSAMIVHDLKSPLAAMMLAGESILGEPLADRPRAAAQNILDGAHVIHRMVMDILDVDRCEDGALQLRLEEVELRALLAACVESARAQARAAGLELALEADGPLGVVADPELVRRVIANLVDNAIQYAPTGSAIRLVAAPGAGERVAIRVHDRGPGVPAAERARVFEPYARIERGAVRAARSSHGLGLAFCKLAVEAHRGRIWIEDDQPAGSVFCVELPCRPTAP